MVYWNNTALFDYYSIIDGLLNWCTETGQKHLDYDSVMKYKNDMVNTFNKIDTLPYHTPVRYKTHAKYGKYAYQYRRNKRTSWYGIYNFNSPDAFLNRIISNYRTISGF